MFPIFGRLIFPVAAISLLILTGCTINLDHDSGGEARTETKSIDLDKSEMVRVVLKMGAGELNVRGGSAKLMDAEFNYNNPRLKPEVHYDGAGFRGHLQVEEPSGSFHGGSSKYRNTVGISASMTRSRWTWKCISGRARGGWTWAVSHFGAWKFTWGLANCGWTCGGRPSMTMT